MIINLKRCLCGVSVVAALSLVGCGGSDDSSVSPVSDAPTTTVAPSYELVGNLLSVTSSGIADADGVTDLVYVLKNSAGQAVVRQTSPRFADLAAGSYTLSTEGRAKNGATGASVAVVNPASVAVTIVQPDTTAPSKVSEDLPFLDNAGSTTSGTITLSEAVDRVTGFRYVDATGKNMIGFQGGALSVTIDSGDAKKLVLNYTVPLWMGGVPMHIEVDVVDKAGNTATIRTQGYSVN